MSDPTALSQTRSHGDSGCVDCRYDYRNEESIAQRARWYVNLSSATVSNRVTDILSLADSGPDDPIMQPTNRGNKMKANAKYVREGAMGYINAEEFYREVCYFIGNSPSAGANGATGKT